MVELEATGDFGLVRYSCILTDHKLCVREQFYFIFKISNRTIVLNEDKSLRCWKKVCLLLQI